MAQVINTNMSALNAQHNLNKSQSAQMTAMQRLSSGLRINSAKDDAAGLAIVERITAEARGLNQAAHNANDGISIAQIAEGGLDNISTILQQMRELAVQAANDANSDLDRASIQNDVQSLYDEIDRISATTDFNGVKLFFGAGADISHNIQVGANANQSVSFKVGQTDTKSLGLNSSVPLGQTYTGRVVNMLVAAGGLVINGIPITAAVLPGPFGANIAGQEAAINNISTAAGVTADAFNKVTGSRATVDPSHIVSGLTLSVAAANGTAGTAVTVDTAFSLQHLMENINRQVGGINTTIGNNGNLVLSNTDGGTLSIAGTTANTGLTAGNYNGFIGIKSNNGTDITFSNPGIGYLTGGNGTMTGYSVQLGGVTPTLGTALAALDLGFGVYDVSVNPSDVVKINGVTIGASSSGSAADKAAAINAIGSAANIKATAQTVVYVSVDASKLGAANSLSINGSAITLAPTDVALNDVITKINTSGISGINASADSATGMLVLTSVSGNDIFVGDEDATGATGGQLVTAVRNKSPTSTALAILAGAVVGVRGKITVTSTNGGAVRIEGDGSASGGTGLVKLGLIDLNSDDVVIGGGLNVSTAAGANAAITAIDAAINTIVTKRAALGLVQNRFESIISTLQVSSENTTVSRSRIQDADFAKESAELSRAQMLQQAGIAILAQANQSNNGVLALLRKNDSVANSTKA